MEKTNVMRILDQKRVPYTTHTYDPAFLDGVSVAEQIGQSPEIVFKTLVTAATTGVFYVFVIPVGQSLDLKKAAKVVGVKAIVMVKQKDLLPTTGYIHGGCSPIGMKKPFKTVIHESAMELKTMIVSAGKVGCQVELDPRMLATLTGAAFADLVE
jgi:Cys-tRNA(Pro)/Cys-tRNA(Cys) deacylase